MLRNDALENVYKLSALALPSHVPAGKNYRKTHLPSPECKGVSRDSNTDRVAREIIS